MREHAPCEWRGWASSLFARDSVWYKCVVTFWSTYKAFLVQPRATAAALASYERRLRLGLAAFLRPGPRARDEPAHARARLALDLHGSYFVVFPWFFANAVAGGAPPARRPRGGPRSAGLRRLPARLRAVQSVSPHHSSLRPVRPGRRAGGGLAVVEAVHHGWMGTLIGLVPNGTAWSYSSRRNPSRAAQSRSDGSAGPSSWTRGAPTRAPNSFTARRSQAACRCSGR